MRARTKVRAFFFYIPRTGGMRIPDRGSTTGDSQLDRLSAQRTGCPQGERSESIPPPHRHIQDESSYESTGFFLLYSPDRGDENPRPGFDNGRQPVGQTERAANRLPAGRAKRVNPPPHRHIQDESAYESTGFFLLYSPDRTPAQKTKPGFPGLEHNG